MPRGGPWRRGKEEADRRLPRGQKAADERTPARKRSCRLRKTTRRSRGESRRPRAQTLEITWPSASGGTSSLQTPTTSMPARLCPLPLGCLAAAGQSLLQLVCFSFSALVLRRLELESGEGR
ncbi:unnamed protein product [Ixodes persulcatus]